ncbi:MAG: 8-oxo-dGTP diphosphatase [Candidatus Moranbacteria bacterium]|nr:8-oxo-dGTP diphosphatase [Candidatus Moranbacteria bacterium]
MKKVLTLCTTTKNNQILLGMKKRGFGAGRWNGFGGKLHDGESIEEATKRETQEECGIIIEKMEEMGIVDFEFAGNPRLDSRKRPLVDARRAEILEVHIFKILKYTSEPVETEEMKPQWFTFDKIPYDSMWPDDKFWLPLFLENKKFKGKFKFDPDGNKILDHEIDIVKS